MKLYRVGEVCQRTGLSRKHLFLYKQVVLPVATEYEGAYKLYDEEGLQKLEEIAFLRTVGLHRPQILEILQDPARERDILRQQKERLQRERGRLETCMEMLEKRLVSLEREERP